MYFYFTYLALLACPSNPCLNGATCYEHADPSTPGYACICPPGYEGAMCEIEIDFCAEDPCQNGAQCEQRTGGYECICVPGWQGTNCETGRIILLLIYL